MKRSEPTDEEIAAVLAAKPSEQWRKLFGLIDSLGELGEHVTWVPRVQTGPKEFITGYPAYSEAFMAIHALLYELDLVVPFNWAEWNRTQRYRRVRGSNLRVSRTPHGSARSTFAESGVPTEPSVKPFVTERSIRYSNDFEPGTARSLA